ncbi:MAG: tetratricopeptide repeat protein, partial [Anaerolineae bacterium]
MVVRKEKSLSEYRAEAEQLLEENTLEAAIAIGQHMLRHHPKYVGAYRVLAKATLEQGEIGHAADLFRRVLSANPEDLEARLGLGIIYTEEQALEEALWQWERAFELAPGKSDIRARLRQVRERVEGAEFPRIELTRGALGRLYARGGLFQQAADEFRSVLAKDPQQVDIQVALAETLWRDGKLAEAEAVCEQILEAMPNCLKANLILGHIWLRTGREEESQGPFEIAQALDPENQVASDLLGEESPLTREPVLVPLPDELPLEALQSADLIAVGEERPPEEWELEEMAAEEEAIEAELPDWLTELRAAAAEEKEEEEAIEGEGLPEWLSAVEPAEEQKVVAEPAPAEAPSFEPSPEPEPESEDAELPDWLTALSEEGPEEPVTAGEEDDRDAPDWLQQLRTETERDLTAIGEPELTLTPSPEDTDRFALSDVPEWLQDIRQESDQPIEAISDEEVLLTAAEPAEEVSDRLAVPSAEPEAAEAAVEPEDEVPDWLAALQTEEPAETEIAAPPVEPETAETDLWREIMREEGLEE